MKEIFTIALCLTPLYCITQILSLELPQYAGKEAIITGLHGIRTDTLGTVILDHNGKGSFAFGDNLSTPGLASLTMRGKKGLRYDFILSPEENPILVCDGEYVHSENTNIRQSEENLKINSWYHKRQMLVQQEALLRELSSLYSDKGYEVENFYASLSQEHGRVEDALRLLEDLLSNSPLYAARLMEYRIAGETILTPAGEGDSVSANAARTYLLEEVDYEELYASGMWFSLINSSIGIYGENGVYYKHFGADMVELLKKTTRLDIYQSLAEAAVSIVERLGWVHDKDVLVAFLKQEGKLQNPEGILGKVLEAPTIGDVVSVFDAQKEDGIPFRFDGLPEGKEFGLLVFYDSTCGHCTELMDGLQPWYNATDMADRIQIYSMALNDNREGWKRWHNVRQFAWMDLWISQGMSSEAAQAYHITGTPSMYLVDRNLKILALPGNMAQLVEYFENPNVQMKYEEVLEGSGE